MKAILGIKEGMTQVFTKDGRSVPVTVVYCEPNLVTAIKEKVKDGYVATQVAIKDLKPARATKPIKGQFEKAGITTLKKHKEEIRNMDGYKVGDHINVDIFQPGQYIDATGISKGHGFSGVAKRWNQKTGPKTHGAGYPHRLVGSLNGARGGSAAQRIWKGRHLPGQYGTVTMTTQNLEIVAVDKEKNVILVKGPIPGANKSFVRLSLAVKKSKAKDVISLVNIIEEERKNQILEEGKKYGIAFDITASVAVMETQLKEAAAKAAAGESTRDAVEKPDAKK